VVRECEEETGRTVLLVLENPRPGDEAEMHKAFEAAVSLAASVALALIKKGLLVGLKTATSYVAPAAGPGQAMDLLEPLALIQARAAEGGRMNVPGDVTIIRIVPASPSPRLEVEARAAARRSA
jgi:uncharacterized protein (DUF58 family)